MVGPNRDVADSVASGDGVGRLPHGTDGGSAHSAQAIERQKGCSWGVYGKQHRLHGGHQAATCCFGRKRDRSSVRTNFARMPERLARSTPGFAATLTSPNRNWREASRVPQASGGDTGVRVTSYRRKDTEGRLVSNHVCSARTARIECHSGTGGVPSDYRRGFPDDFCNTISTAFRAPLSGLIPFPKSRLATSTSRDTPNGMRQAV